jgi:tetratricopeptide (TPR) repeat protein
MRPRVSAFVITLPVVVVLIGLPALAAPGSAAGRKHAAKANQLAAQNKCKTAVFEFTKAYKLLKDPALLFNRAECYRKIGKDSQAVKDYEQFLAEMPAAPNRATIEARIASLRGSAPVGETAAAKAPVKPAEQPAPANDTHAEKWGASDATSPGDNGKATDNGPGVGSAAVGTAAPAATEPRAAANLTTQPLVPEPKHAGASHAWVWIGTAVVVVGAGAFAAYHYWPRPKTDVPQTPLGNYAF